MARERMVRKAEAQLLGKGWRLRGTNMEGRGKVQKGGWPMPGIHFRLDRPKFLLSIDNFVNLQHCCVFE